MIHISRETNLVDVAEDDLLDGVVLEHFTDDAAVATTNDEHLLRVRVASQGKVGDHLLVPVLRSVRSIRDLNVGIRTRTHRAQCTG